MLHRCCLKVCGFFFTVVSISYVVLSPRDALNRHYTVENILIGALWMIMWHRDETALSKMLVGTNTGVSPSWAFLG